MVKFSKVFVLGAGAIGSAYGALLARKIEVTLIGSRAHVEAIRNQGLKLAGDIEETILLEADVKISEVPSNSLILLTTKAHDSAHAVRQIRGMLRKDTVILILQNGLGNEAIIKKQVSEIEVMRGLTMMAAEFLTPGRIRVWKGETILARSKSAMDIARLFDECGLKTRISGRFTDEVWNKLILNCVVNPLTALFQLRNNELASETLKWVKEEVLQECSAIGKAEGAKVEVDLEKLDRRISSYTNFSSMCQDIMKGKKTEVEFLNGTIVTLGEEHNIPTPVNRTLTCLTRFLEERQVGVRRRD